MYVEMNTIHYFTTSFLCMRNTTELFEAFSNIIIVEKLVKFYIAPLLI